MTAFARTDTSVLGRWWWTVDRWILAALIVLMGFGAVLVLAASTAAAERIGLPGFRLAQRQFALLPLAMAGRYTTGTFPPSVRRTRPASWRAALRMSAAPWLPPVVLVVV